MFNLDKAREEYRLYKRNTTAVYGKHFTYYNAAVVNLAINPDRPWQLITNQGCIIATYDSEGKAKLALETLEKEWDTLPCDLRRWSKAYLLNN